MPQLQKDFQIIQSGGPYWPFIALKEVSEKRKPGHLSRVAILWDKRPIEEQKYKEYHVYPDLNIFDLEKIESIDPVIYKTFEELMKDWRVD